MSRNELVRMPRLGRLAKSVALLATGSVIAQAIAFVASPLLTRLYSPADFGVVAAFSAVVLVLGAVSTARFHMAIPIAESDREAVDVATLSLVVSACVSTASLVVLCVLWPLRRHVPMLEAMGAWSFLIPLFVFLTGLIMTLWMWNTRRGDFRRISASTAFRTLVGTTVSVVLGLFSVGVAGMFAGSVANLLAGNRTLMQSYFVALHRERTSTIRLRSVARKYVRFPSLDMPSTLASTLAPSLVVFGCIHLYGETVAGQYSLVARVLTVPTAVVGGAMSQVYFREAAIRVGNPAARVRALSKTVKGMAMLSLPAFVLVLALSPIFFPVVFGAEWEQAGQFARAVAPLAWVQFFAQPVTSTFLVHRRQGSLLAWNAASVILTLVAIASAGAASLEPTWYFWILTLLLVLPAVGLVVQAFRIAVVGQGQSPEANGYDASAQLPD